MAIIKTADQVRTYNKAFASLKDNDIVPYAADAEEKYIKPYLGADLYDSLVSYIDDGETGNAGYDALLPYVRRAASRFTLLMATPFLDINVGATGFTTSNTAGMVPASDARVKRFTDGLEKMAWENVETMLKFLEENKDNYGEWIESDAYTIATESFIHTAEEFSNLVPARVNRLMFSYLKPQMNNVEKLKILSILPQTLIDEIKSQLNGAYDDVTAANQALLDYIKLAIAYLTMSGIIVNEASASDTSFILQFIDLPREEYEKMGNFYLMEIQNVIDANPDNYPLYTASDYYDADKENNDLIENDEDDPVLFLGAIPIG